MDSVDNRQMMVGKMHGENCEKELERNRWNENMVMMNGDPKSSVLKLMATDLGSAVVELHTSKSPTLLLG